MSKNDCEGLIDSKELAGLLKVSVSFVNRSRRLYGMPHYKYDKGHRSPVRFRLSEVEGWLKQRRVAV